jgi:fructan beta-fructosidase
MRPVWLCNRNPVIAPLREEPLPIAGSAVAPYELDLQFGRPSVPVFGVRLYSDAHHWTEIGFDIKKKELYIDRTQSGAPIDNRFPAKTTAPLVLGRPYDLQLVADRTSVEAFAQNGTIAMTNLIFPTSPKNAIHFFPDGAATGQFWQLKSIWNH